MRSESTVRLTGHLAGLDGVRGTAILMVMAVHFVGDAQARTLTQRVVVKAASYGLAGGGPLLRPFRLPDHRACSSRQGEPHYFRNFYARRTLRIFPLYYFVLALLFLLLASVHHPVSAGSRWPAATRPGCGPTPPTSTLRPARSWSALTYVSHFWSLAIEEHFYLLWPLVVFSFRRAVLERTLSGRPSSGVGPSDRPGPGRDE